MTDNYFNSEEFKDNLSHFEDARKEGKGCILSSDEIADIAEYYYEQGDFAKAKEIAEYATSLYPDATAPLVFLARFQMTVKKDMDMAWKYLTAIKDTEDSEYVIMMAEYLFNDGQREEAIDTLERGLVVVDSDDAQDFIIDASFLLLDFAEIGTAKKWAERYEDKNDEEFQRLRARIALESKDGDKAAKIMNELIDKNPFNEDYWNLLATIQIASDKYSDAATSSEYAIAINGDSSEAYMNQGNAYFKMCNYDKALEAYKQFSKLNRNEIGDIMQARCYFCKQDLENALKHLKRAKDCCTDNKANLIDVYKDMAIIFGWAGENERAFKCIDRLKKEGYNDAELYLIEGGVLLGMDKFKEASTTFMNGYEKSKQPQEYMFQVAVSFYERNFDQAAYTMLKEIFYIEPDRTRGLAYLAVCCNYLGKKDEFLKYLKMAIEKNPDEARAVLAEIFPRGMEIYDYYKYAVDFFDRQKGNS